MRAKETTQLSVFLGHHPGVVADVCSALSEAELSIRAMAVLDTVDVGTMRLVLDDPQSAKEALRGSGAAYVEVPVLTLEIRNRAGTFAHIARMMADSGVNIEYVYATVMPGTERTLGVFRVSDVETALKIDFPDE